MYKAWEESSVTGSSGPALPSTALCPEDYPYAFKDGSSCCKSFARKSTCDTAAANPGHLLQVADSAHCCDVGTKSCPGGAAGGPCSSHPVNDTGSCPAGHPAAVSHGAKCCSSVERGPFCDHSGWITQYDEEKCCSGTSVDCPDLPLPCESSLPVYVISSHDMIYSEAETYCQSVGLEDAEFANLEELRDVFSQLPQLSTRKSRNH